MAEYIERESFIEAQRHLYCDNCARRKGMKNGKMKFVYAIGDAPCRACDIGDMLDSIEDYVPAADVVPVRHGRWINADDGESTVRIDEDGCPVYSGYCSECNDWLTGSDEYAVRGRYCPNCGVRMDGDGE